VRRKRFLKPMLASPAPPILLEDLIDDLDAVVDLGG
jgi:hypothetical protein